MENLETQLMKYIEYCKFRKNLNVKTLKAYEIDLKQFKNIISKWNADPFERNSVNNYITEIHKVYKPKSIKRKIASIKAFFHYLEYEDLILSNPFSKIDIRFRKPQLLPKNIPFHMIRILGKVKTEERSASLIFSDQLSILIVLIMT